MIPDNASFLRYLIDFIDGNHDGIQSPSFPSTDRVAPPAAPTVVVVQSDDDDDDNSVDPTEIDSPVDDDTTFVPPLQAKIEIMKKMAGIEQKNQDLVAPAMDDDDGPFAG